jgi:protein gp37
MADGTKIEWSEATWNPITGCSLASPGCTNCYAMELAGTRLAHIPSRAGLTRKVNGNHVWTGEVRFNEQWLDQPLRWKKPRMIFVCAHGDLFHEKVPDEWIDKVFAVMALASQHTFQVLTKRSARMREYISKLEAESQADTVRRMAAAWPHPISQDMIVNGPNVWLGVSVEDQQRADERIPDLLATPAAIRWISAEPLLGPVVLTFFDCAKSSTRGMYWVNALTGDHDDMGRPCAPVAKLDWVVAGGESGRGARGSTAEVERWMRSLRDQCAAVDVPFFGKQNWAKLKLPDDLMVRQWPTIEKGKLNDRKDA